MKLIELADNSKITAYRAGCIIHDMTISFFIYLMNIIPSSIQNTDGVNIAADCCPFGLFDRRCTLDDGRFDPGVK